MKNLLSAVGTTFIVWLVTLLTAGPLPFFSLFMCFCLSYLVCKELKYEGEK